MHLHLPKPLHGWRAFAGEVGIIVIGVLIALGAEQAVESAQWTAKARTAKHELHEEMVLAWLFADEREVRHKCADDYLVHLARTIVSSPPQWRPVPADYCDDHHAWVYIPPDRPWPTEVWRSVETEGTVSHFGGSYPRQASFLFDFIKSMGDENGVELKEAAALNALAFPITPTSDSKAEFIKSIERLQYYNDDMTLASRQMQDQISALGEAPTSAELSLERPQVPQFETDRDG